MRFGDPKGPADLVLRGAPVYRGGRWDGDCLAVREGRIAAIGSYDDVAPLVVGGTAVRDLTGLWLLPGFHDAHVHPVQAGLEMNQCDLTGTTDVADYLARIARYAAAEPERPWVTGGGWSMDSFPGGVPTADLLDSVCPDRPVYLPNRDHHSAWVNTRALEVAGVHAGTPDPRDGRVERHPDGRPSGALHEGAMALVGRVVPPPGAGELRHALLTAQAHLHSFGIVGWQDALVGTGLGMPDTLPTYLAAHRAGELTAKVVLALWWDRHRGLEQLPELVERRRRAAEVGVRAGSVKVMLDGVCETRTASMLDPYRDADGTPTANHGLSFIAPRDLARYVAALDAEDFQVHVHALGDRAVRDSLDAIEHAAAVNGRRGNRHHLAHVQVVAPADVTRFAELDVTANCQPSWACHEEVLDVLTLPFLSDRARSQQYVFGSLLRAGARLAAGSDWPVSSPDPLEGIHVAVHRTAPGTDAEPLIEEEAVGVTEALAAYTTGSTFVNRLEGSSGRLQVGHAADIAVVDSDLLGAWHADIAGVRVSATYVDGREVYRA